MALSKSVIKAQDIISCNLCESETKLKWKCIDCDLLMCNKCCDKVHPKFKNAKDHAIVDIKQIGLSSGVRDPDFTNIKCKVHTLQSCCIFCSNCDTLACPSCITKGHAGHTFIEIKEAYEMKIELLKNLKGKLEMNEKKLDEGEKTLDQISFRENSNCQKTIQDIQLQNEALLRELDKYAFKLIEEVNQNMKSIKDSITIEKEKVVSRKRTVANDFQSAEIMLTTRDMSSFFENADTIVKSSYDDDDVEGVNVIHKCVPKFKPGEIIQSNLGTLFEDISSSNTVMNMKVKKEFTTGLKQCHHIAVSSDELLWIGDSSPTNRKLHKVKLDGNILTTLLTINTRLGGMTVTEDNNLMIADVSSTLKLVNGQTGKISDSKYSVDPLKITAVHITSDNKVIVGAKSPGDVYPVTGRRVVIVMDQGGNHVTVYEHDKHKQNIFSYPWSITSTSNGKIVAMDSLSIDRIGRVLVLGKDGDIFNKYIGYQDMKTKGRPFKPCNITTTPSDNIIVIDANDCFHVIDSSANLIFYYNAKDIGIENSFCLSFTSSTSFYLGCLPLEGITKNAKLYEIQCPYL